MKWKKIGYFLKRFDTAIQYPVTKKVIIDVVGEKTGVLLNSSDISIRQGSVFLNIDPTKKFLVYKKKDLIEKSISETLGGTAYNLR